VRRLAPPPRAWQGRVPALGLGPEWQVLAAAQVQVQVQVQVQGPVQAAALAR
jgi:hypothetical protein